MSSLATDLADQIRAARSRADLTQEELARRLRVSARTIQNWERGSMPRPAHRRKLKRFLEKAAA